MIFSAGMRAVGLEIDAQAVRAVELKPGRSGVQLRAAGRCSLPEGAVSAGVVQETDAVADALHQLWSDAGFAVRDVVVGVANQGMFMRSITFPRVPRENLEDALRLQAGEHLPIPLEQLVMDFAVLDEITGEEGEELYELLLVAVRRDQLQRTLDALQHSGLRPVVVDASPLALARNLEQSELAGSIVLADVAGGVTSLLVVSGGQPVFARVSPVGLSSLNGRPGDDDAPAADDREAQESWARELAQEINTSVHYYLTQTYDEVVDALIISGCGSRPDVVPEILEEALEMPVRRLDPLRRLAVVRDDGIDWESDASDFAVSIGLGHRAIEEGAG